MKPSLTQPVGAYQPSLTSPLASGTTSTKSGEEKPRSSMHWTFYLYCTKRFSSKIRRFVEQNRLFTGIYYKISMHQQGKNVHNYHYP